MDNKDIFDLNNQRFQTNKNLMTKIITKLENLIQYASDEVIKLRVKEIIIIMNKVINYNELIRKDIEKLNNDANVTITKFKNLLEELRKKGNIIVKTYNNGKYEGEFKNGKKEGIGIYYFNNGGRYEGEWKNDVQEGKGKDYFDNGDRYEGDFKNGLSEGKGIYYYNNGNKYIGDWKNGQKNGNGINYYNGGTYKGEWKDGKRQRKGIYYSNFFINLSFFSY